LNNGVISWTLGTVSDTVSVQVRFVMTATGTFGSVITNDAYGVVATNFPTSTMGAPVLTTIGDYTPIYTIQGNDFLSPFRGSLVKTRGVVVGFFEGNYPGSGSFNGFFIQDENGDGDPATSDGIFVHVGTDAVSPTVQIGDVVTVTGTVEEFIEWDDNACPDTECITQIRTSMANVQVAGTGNVAPTVITPVGDPALADAYWESLEGMLVTAPNTQTVTGPTSFGAIYVIPGREGVRSRCARADCGQRCDRCRRPARLLLRRLHGGHAAGQTVAGCERQTTAAVANRGDLHRGHLQHTQLRCRRPSCEDDQGGLHRAATGWPHLPGTAGNRQHHRHYRPHRQSRCGWRALRLRGVASRHQYQACSSNGSTSAPAYDSYCDAIPDAYPLFSRRPVVLTGTLMLDSGPMDVVVIANHFKSKRGGAPSDARRLEQGQFIGNLAAQLYANGSRNIIILGDLNDFEDSPPLQAIYASGVITSTWYQLPPNERYTFIFEGVSQVLDHVLISNDLLLTLKGVSALRTNVDYPHSPYANLPVVWRASDHDPVVATFGALHRLYFPLLFKNAP